jgi:enoyl-CoA hydratase/carnithine racemase
VSSLPLNRAGEPIVLTEQRGHIGIVTMNRPEARNAMSSALSAALTQTWARQEADPDIWVHVLTGTGEAAFCAGMDLKEAAAIRLGGAAGGGKMPTRDPDAPIGYGGVSLRLRKPIIAAINGYALGGGCEMALACDLLVMEEHAQIGLTEVRRGLAAGAGGNIRLPRRIPPTIALEAVLTGIPLSAQRAYELGMVNRLVPTGKGLDAAIELAEVICEAAPIAVQYAKAVTRASYAVGEQEANDAAPELREKWWNSNDMKEGPLAFAEKRPPQWTNS